jgi:D-glycero-alpha-D-manno-heptose-7-phosphate kinase
MIITRTPLRISFAGGMSDIPAFYEKDYGCVLSTAIDRYIYIAVNKRFMPFFRIKYSQTENVDHIEDIRHTLVRECLKFMHINDPLEITAISELPSRTGLGSSSAFTVGLLNALHAYKGEESSQVQLAEEACHIEIDILKNPIGKQDQYASAIGGCNYITFTKDEITIEPIGISGEVRRRLQMFYLGKRGEQPQIHEHIAMNMEKCRPIINKVRDITLGLLQDIREDNIIQTFGDWLDLSWYWKQQVTPTIAPEEVTSFYSKAIANGAQGGKLLGEGNSGFMLLYKRPSVINELIEKLPGKYLPFNFDFKGSMVVYEG